MVIANNVAMFGRILQSVSIVMGIGLCTAAFFQLKRYGEMRTMMSSQMSIHTPVMMLLAGIMLLLIPSTLSTFLYSFWGTSSPLRYDGLGSRWSGVDQYMPAVLIFVRVVGVGAFMRGIVLMHRAAGHSGQPGQIAKCLLHMCGGLMCMHILGVVHLLKNILDIT